MNKTNPIKAKTKKNNLALKIIPELTKSEARFVISGSSIKLNQIFDRKNAMDNPNKNKRLIIHKYEKPFFDLLA